MILYAGKTKERQGSSTSPENLSILKSIIEGRVNRLVELGFHQEFYPQVSSEEAKSLYKKDFVLPEGVLLPEGQGAFPEIFVIDPRIKNRSLLRLGEIVEFIGLRDDPVSSKEKPYLAFTSYTDSFRGLEPDEAVGKFRDNEIGFNLSELMYLYVEVPGFFNNQGLYAVESKKWNLFSYLVKFHGRQEIHVASVGYPSEYFRVISRLKETIILGS